MSLNRNTIPVWGSRTYMMGILNVTPDSFSGDGLLFDEHYVAHALRLAEAFIVAGVDIIDVGGESTRPGAEPVAVEAECQRVVPVIEALSTAFPQTLLSVDTSKAEVAKAALAAGASWVNDVWSLRADPDLAGVVAESKAPIILMHNRLQHGSEVLSERLGGRYVGVAYDDLMPDIVAELLGSVAFAHEQGVADTQIILDPGIGFGKTVSQNLTLINHLDKIKALGYPLLVGPSRKSFIGYTLNLPPDQRLEGTAAAAAICIDRGADILRVHDVAEMVRVARMTDAIVRR